MKVIENNHLCTVSPDFVRIPDWGYSLKYNDKNAITIAYNKKELVITRKKHYQIRMRDGFFGRLWTNSKVLSWWYTPEYNPYVTIHEIIDCINYGIKCIIDEDIVTLPDINTYTVIFNESSSTIISLSIPELKQYPFKSQYDNNRIKRLHVMPPTYKFAIKNIDDSIKRWNHLYYIEDCKVWTNRIGLMDVAEWHLYN